MALYGRCVNLKVFFLISFTIAYIFFTVSALGNVLTELRCIQLGNSNAERESIFHKNLPTYSVKYSQTCI